MVTDRDTRITRLARLYGIVDVETVYRLFGRRKYYRCGTPLGRQALTTAFALLRFCVLTNRPKVACHELGATYTFLSSSSLSYAKEGEGLRALRVDHGGDADALVRKFRDQHKALYHHDQYRQLVAGSLFSASILTYSEDKAREIQRYLKANPPPYAVTAVVIPDLLQLL